MKFFENRANVFGSLVAALLLLTAGEIGVKAIVLSRDQTCVQNLYALGESLREYAQDYDDQYPTIASGAGFQNEIGPYVKNPSIFLCPATKNKPYVMNPNFAGIEESHISDTATAALVYDSIVHPTGATTIFFADGHVEQGGVYQLDPGSPVPGPHIACQQHAESVAIALLEYTQDYDGSLPPMDSNADFETALAPYLPFTFDFECPETLSLYKIDTALNGHNMNDFANPSTVEVLRDSAVHSDGTVTIAYLDGHVVTTTP